MLHRYLDTFPAQYEVLRLLLDINQGLFVSPVFLSASSQNDEQDLFSQA
jgi:hypothetical protein